MAQSVISFVAAVFVIGTVLFPYGTVAANVAETSLYLKRFIELIRNDISDNEILSDYVEYNYAQCVFVNNNGLDSKTTAKNDVVGKASLKQATNGGALEVSINLQGIDKSSPLQHGFHVHQYGDLSNGCTSTGGHFNPHDKEHGAPSDTDRHVGDWGNVDVSKGAVKMMLNDNMASLKEGDENNIIGRAIVLHALTDDLGQGGDAESKKTGNAGARLACCVIGYAPQPEE